MYGYIDESGVIRATKDNYIGVALIIFNDINNIESASQKIKTLRHKLSLSKDYEFHLSRNSDRVKAEFTKTIAELNFVFIYVYLKNINNSKCNTIYLQLAHKIVARTAEITHHINIKMDDNPALYQALRKASTNYPIKFSCKQAHSHNYDLIQVADYIVGLATKDTRGKRVDLNWKHIKKKMIQPPILIML